MARIGQQVTARLAGAMRGAVVIEIMDGAVKVECQCPKRLEFTIENGKWQDSAEWNNPNKRKI